MTIPKVGQIWEREGKQRKVHSVSFLGVLWHRPHKQTYFYPAVHTWQDWAKHATLICDPSKENQDV